MANNPFWLEATLKDTHGVNENLGIGSQLTPIQAEARVLVDDDFIAGVVDLDPYLASIANPSLIVIDVPLGATVSFDSGVTWSAFSLTRILLDFVPAGAIAATVQLTLAAPSRVRMWSYGD